MSGRRGVRTAVLSGLCAAWLLIPALAGTGAAGVAATGAAATGAALPTTQEPPGVDLTESPVVVRVDTLLPRAPRPGDHLQISGVLVNTGRTAVSQLRVRLRLGAVLDTRGELQQAELDEPATRPRQSTEIALARVDLPAGQQTTFDLRTTVDSLAMHALGVYPLQVEVRGVVGAEGRWTQVGRAATYLPWFGSQRVVPTRLVWLWPVVDIPRRTPREVMLDDELATSFTAPGRLGRLLRAGRAGERGLCSPEPRPPDGVAQRPRPPERRRCLPVPVTYVVDPDLLSTAEARTRSYTVQQAGQSRAMPSSPSAAQWLDSLGDAARDSAVVALPYADPDVLSVTGGPDGLVSELSDAKRIGNDLVREVLRTEPLTGIAWPPTGRLTAPALEALLGEGPSHVVLDESALSPPDLSLNRTPGARVYLPTTTPATGLVLEGELGRLLQPEPDQGRGTRLAEQRFLAETAMIAADRPNESRTLVVAPPRRGDLDPGLVAQALLDTGRVPWLCPVTLADVARSRETCAGERAAPSYQPELRGTLEAPDGSTARLSDSQVNQVAETRNQGTQLTDAVLKPGSPQLAATRARLQRAIARSLSSAWRTDEARGRRLTELLQDDVDDLTGMVRVLTGSGPILFTSDRGRLRVALQNRLGQPVVVRVRIDAANNARLTSDSSQRREIPPNTALQVDVPAQVLTSGQFRVQAQLLDRDGRAFGDPAVLVVRSTRYGNVALGVTGVGAAVLLGAAGVRIVRRARGVTAS